jgi:hypothetical protein
VKTYPATAYSGLSPRRLWAALARGELPRVRVPGARRTLIDVTDLDAFLEAHKDTSP